MVLLILLIVATAALIAWLLVEIARFAFGAPRLAGVRAGSLHSPSPRQTASEHAGQVAASQSGASGEERLDERSFAEQPLYDEAEVEQAIRDRLYGGLGRRRS